MRPRLNTRYIPLIATGSVFVALYLVGILNFRNFGSLYNCVNLFGDNAFLGIAAVGATFVILSGGIDLSVGSVVAFTSILVATLIEKKGVHPGLAIVLALFLGALFGSVMGLIIFLYRVPPFMVTLAGMFFARGMGFIIRPQSLGLTHEFYETTVVDSLAIPLTNSVSIPFWAVCFAAVTLVGVFVLHLTGHGRNVYAIGGDEKSAELMGLPVARTKILVYTTAGLCSAMAGVVYSFYTQSGDPAAALGLELEAIASVVIGGTLLSGGGGYLVGTVFGVLILGLIQSLIAFQGSLNSWWTKIAVGVLLLLFILLQKVFSAMADRGARIGATGQEPKTEGLSKTATAQEKE